MNKFIKKLIERLEEQKGNPDAYCLESEKRLVRHWNVCVDNLIEIVNELAEEYNNGWIPLTKKLPEYGQYVLACIPPKHNINGGHPVVIMEFREDNEPLFYRFVSAWQPLPEPYKQGKQV